VVTARYELGLYNSGQFSHSGLMQPTTINTYWKWKQSAVAASMFVNLSVRDCQLSRSPTLIDRFDLPWQVPVNRYQTIRITRQLYPALLPSRRALSAQSSQSASTISCGVCIFICVLCFLRSHVHILKLVFRNFLEPNRLFTLRMDSDVRGCFIGPN
jgi:hypothetical protein